MDPWCPINAPLGLGAAVDRQLLGTGGTGGAAHDSPGRAEAEAGPGREAPGPAATADGRRAAVVQEVYFPGRMPIGRYLDRVGIGVYGFDPSPRFRRTFGAREGAPYANLQDAGTISCVLIRPHNRMPPPMFRVTSALTVVRNGRLLVRVQWGSNIRPLSNGFVRMVRGLTRTGGPQRMNAGRCAGVSAGAPRYRPGSCPGCADSPGG